MPFLDGILVLMMNQKLDHLLSVSATQAAQLTHATSPHESTQQEVKYLAAQVNKLREQLREARAVKVAKTARKDRMQYQ